MIEVEKKFNFDDSFEKKLRSEAEFLGEQIFIDEYFDNEQLSLSTQNMWLRKRNESFDLKIPVHNKDGDRNKAYHEIEGELAIREIFAIPVVKSFIEDLKDLGHKSFCRLTTRRLQFKKDELTIVLDEVRSDDWKYCIGEIELLVNHESEIEGAMSKIESFAKKNELITICSLGKVMEYLKAKDLEKYQILLSADFMKVE